MKVNNLLPAYLALAAVVVAAEEAAQPEVHFEPTTLKATFIEQFTDDWDKRWVVSEAKKVVDGVEDEQLLRYRGKWAVESVTPSSIAGDKGLVAKDAAAHHAIAARFAKPIDPAGKPLVVQYEVLTQNGNECGGSYMKLLTYDDKFDPKNFSDKTPYTIMFGPDRCAATDKVHFIFRHKNPVTGEYQEKHMTSPPKTANGKKTALYTLKITPDQKFSILVNNKEVKTGSLLSDFDPPVVPPKEIDDPEDKMPADWDSRKKIPDPDAKKPDDWDENEPREIPDADAKKPDTWLENEPLTIPDPDAVKPEDWDDEEDGDWVPPTVPNPKCAKGECGDWKRPMKANPKYKGKWSAPLIDNPKYQGVWAPRKIPNPDYFEDLTPANFNKIGAIGFEIWTMQDGITFDNIYVGHSEKDAEKLAEETWVVKNKIETALEEKNKPAPPTPEAAQDLPIQERVKAHVLDFIERAQVNPIQAVKDLPYVATGIVAAILLPVLLIITVLSGGSAKGAPKKGHKVEKKAKVVVTEQDEVFEEELETTDETSQTEGARKRVASKQTASTKVDEE